MGYRVSAISKAGGGISVIVSDAVMALEKIRDYHEDGLTEVLVRELDGNLVNFDPPLADGTETEIEVKKAAN